MSRNHNFNSIKAALLGRSGRGKSTLQRQLVRGWHADVKIIFDHKGEFAALLPAYQARTPAQCDAALSQTRSVCYRPEGRPKDAFPDFCRAAFEFAKQQPKGTRTLFVFDECGLLVPKHPSLYEDHPIRDIAETGREFGMDMLFAAQQPTQICTELRNQVSQWICFQLSCKAVEPLADEFGLDDVSEITRLPKGHYFGFDVEAGEPFRGQSKPDNK